MPKRPDRRVERTRRMLREALVSLMAEKGFEAVTVQDILDRADVGRSTFYAHYRDKEELLLGGLVGRRSGEVVQQRIRRMIAELVREDLAAIAPARAAEPIPREAVVEFVVGAFLALVHWWTEGGARTEPEQVDEIFRKLTLPGVSAVLGFGRR